MNARVTFAQIAAGLAIGAFLVIFLIAPVLTVIYVAFADGNGGFTLSHFISFFQLTLMRESFANSLYVAGFTVGITSLIGVPLAYFTVRFRFTGAAIIQTLGILQIGRAHV